MRFTVGIAQIGVRTGLLAAALSVGLAAPSPGRAFADGASLHPGVGGHIEF